MRASAQLLSYEAAFGLAILGVLVQAGTLSTHDIVAQQSWLDWKSPFARSGSGCKTFVAFVIFLIAATAETNHPPFDLVEAEQELVGGFNTEYTGIRFAIFFLAEFMNVITMSAIAVTLFLGGPSGPSLGFLSSSGFINVWVMPIFWFLVKVLALLFATVWVRASLPRMRYDKLMALGWKYLIEIAILWVLDHRRDPGRRRRGLEHGRRPRSSPWRSRSPRTACCTSRCRRPDERIEEFH